MRECWTFGDFINYEFLLSKNSSSRGESYRNWFQNYRGNPRDVLLAWTRFHADNATPGRTAGKIYGISILGLAIIGFIGGGGLSWGLLAYGGGTPVNLFLALALLVAFPGCLTLISLLPALLPPSKRRYEMLARKFTRLFNFGLGAARRLGFLSRGRSDAIESGMAGFKGHWRNYSPITRWYLSVVLQFRAVFFNLGIFLAILLRGAIQDLAFAWQTSLPLDPVHIHSFAQSLARPWRHLISPPTLEQVAGSRLILKEGISALANADLLSWWPYIVCASLAYGLLPRLLVLLYCLIRRAIAACTPNFLDERGRNFIAAMESLSLVPAIGGKSDSAAELGRLEAVKIHILSPSIRPDLSETEFWKKYLHERWQAELCQLIPVELDDDSDRDAFEQLEDSLKDGEAVMIVFEGWRPYTSAAALYVDALSERLPKGVRLITALAGRPSGEEFEQDAEILTQWSRLLPAATMAEICVTRVLEEFV